MSEERDDTPFRGRRLDGGYRYHWRLEQTTDTPVGRAVRRWAPALFVGFAMCVALGFRLAGASWRVTAIAFSVFGVGPSLGFYLPNPGKEGDPLEEAIPDDPEAGSSSSPMT